MHSPGSLRKASTTPGALAAPRRPKRSESLAGRTLLAVARQRKGLDAARCQVVFEHLDTAQALQLTLHRALAGYQLSDLQFAVLVALFALDPEPATPADLADYTAVSRAAITDALVRLETLDFVSRARDRGDRRVHQVHLTPAGQTAVDRALMVYLRAAGEAARLVEPVAHRNLLSAYQLLQQGAFDATSTSLSS